MRIIHYPTRETWRELAQRPVLELEFLESVVRNILTRVKRTGDKALKELTLQYDKANLERLQVTGDEIKEAEGRVPEVLKKSIAIAASNIRKFHQAQVYESQEIETMPGVVCWRKAVAVEKVGIYIPGGSAPLFSSILMLGIPALLAGCREIILCTPPAANGTVNPAILYTANTIGINKIFKVGGAQAIAAMAFGTETIPAVNKVFGPGNQFVTKAKQLVNQEGVAIDLPAGPSELLLLADEKANVSYIAADLLSQAEHGADSQVVLVTTSNEVLKHLPNELESQLAGLPRESIAKKALENSLGILLTTDQDAIDFINEYAPEHLIINTENCEAISKRIVNAGSVFIGEFSPESIGDYASGTNHTLPTHGFAKAYSGVSVESFMKFITFQRISKRGIHEIGPTVEVMAEAEQLLAHKKAVRIRLEANP
jgi:histidinol dehydrogenase